MKSSSACAAPAVASLTRCIRYALAVGALTVAAPVFAQEASAASDAKTLDAVQVTGSRIQRTTTDTETSQPINVVDGETFAERGFINAAEAINEMPQVMGSVTEAGDQEGTQTGKQFINLFNLGSERTLTLVNGRRFVSTNAGQGGQVDLNNIPTSLIERIEVVQATGSAVYGSDAVAGVVNILLKDTFEGVELDLQTGLSGRGDYERHSGSLTGGFTFNDGRGSVIANLDWSKTGQLLATDRKWTSRGFTFIPNPADTGPNDGIPASIGTPDHRMSEHPIWGTLYTVPAPLPQFRLNLNGGPVRFDEVGNLVPYDIGQWVQPAFAIGGEGIKISERTSVRSPVERTLFTVIGRYDLTNAVRFSAELTSADMKAFEPLNQGEYSSALLTTTPAGALRMSVDNPFLTDQARGLLQGAGVSSFWLSRFHTDLMPNSGAQSETSTKRAVFALDGDFEVGERFFNWGVVANYGRSEGSYRNFGILQQNFMYATDAVRDASGNIVCRVTQTGNATGVAAGCKPLNLFGQNVASQEAKDYITGIFGADYETRQTNYQFNFGGDLLNLPAGTVNFATGFEYRKEFSDYNPIETSALGLGRGTPVLSMRGEYDTTEFFGELLIPVLGGDFTFGPIKALELEAAYRTVDNSLAGKNEAISTGFRMSIFDDLTVRGTWNKTFRAPSINELFQPRTLGTTSGLDPCDTRYINAGANAATRAANCKAMLASKGLDPNAAFSSLIINVPTYVYSGGNPNLKNETAESWTAGLVYQPRFAKGLTLSLDHVDMTINDAISYFDVAATLQACYDQAQPNDYCQSFTRGADAQIVQESMTIGYTNAGYMKLGSTTFTANWSVAGASLFGGRDAGHFDFGLTVSHLDKLDISVSGLGYDEYDAVGTGLLGVALIGPSPENQARFNARWARGPWTLSWASRWSDGLVYDRTWTIEQRDILGTPSVVQHDLSAQFAVNEKLRLRFVVNNVTEQEPPVNMHIGPGNYNSLFDVVGRYFYAGLNYRF